jgi:hypothetical protein
VLRLRQPTWVLLSRSYAAAESHSVNESGESCHDEPLHRKALVKSTALLFLQPEYSYYSLLIS